MNTRAAISLLLVPASLVMPAHARAAAAADISLTDASGGDCALSWLVFDRVHKKGQPRRALLSSATPFLNDKCDPENHIYLGVNGQVVQLQRRAGSFAPKVQGTHLFYAGAEYTLDLTIGSALESFYDPDTECTEGWFSAKAVIGHSGREWLVNGTLVGGCP